MAVRKDLLKAYLADDPSDSFLRYALALELMKEERFEESLDELEQVIHNDPSYLPAYYMAGRAAEHLKQQPVAAGYYRKGISVAEAQRDDHTLKELKAVLFMIEPDEDE